MVFWIFLGAAILLAIGAGVWFAGSRRHDNVCRENDPDGTNMTDPAAVVEFIYQRGGGELGAFCGRWRTWQTNINRNSRGVQETFGFLYTSFYLAELCGKCE